MNNTKTWEELKSLALFSCDCESCREEDLSKLKSFTEKVEAAAFKRGLERAVELIHTAKVEPARSAEEIGVRDIKTAWLEETKQVLVDAITRLPDEGADKK